MSSEEEDFSQSNQSPEDSEFSDIETRGRPPRKLHRQINVTKDEPPRRSLRPRRQLAVQVDDPSEEESDAPEQPKQRTITILNPPIASIHSLRHQGGRTSFFVRFQNSSFHQCKWVEEAELLRLDPSLRSKLKRFETSFYAEAHTGLDFHMINCDAQSYEVDRIVDCSEVFALIHPKKAGEIKNKWTENLLRVVRGLVSFRQEHVRYGAFYIDLSALYRENPEIESPLDLSIIVNRVYLDYYQSAGQFWNDVGLMFRNVERICDKLDKKSDVSELNERMRYVASCLYEDWYLISLFQKTCLERYRTLVQEQPGAFEAVCEDLRQEIKAYEENAIPLSALAAKIDQIFTRHEAVLSFRAEDNDLFFEEIKELARAFQSEMQVEGPEVPDQGPHSLKHQDFVYKLSHSSLKNGKKLKSTDASPKSEQIRPDETPADPASKITAFAVDVDQVDNDLSDEPTIQISEQLQLRNDAELTLMGGHSQKPIETGDGIPQKTQIDAFLSKLKIRLYLFETLRDRLTNADFLKFFADLEKSTAWLMPLDEPHIVTEHDWISPADPQLKLHTQTAPMFRVKWCNLSYTELTWERESDLTEFDEQVKNYKRFTRTVDRETRKSFLFRLQKFNELKELYENPKKLSKTSPAYISDLKRRIFVYKDPKNLIQYCPKTQPIFRDGRILRSYQLESLNWMVEAWTKRRNIILADEMGLGKTIQAMAFLNHLIVIEQVPGPYLVLAPLSTLAHWKRVFEQWTHLNSLLYYDVNGKLGREACRETEFSHSDITMKGFFIKNNKIPKFQVLITSFEVFIQDFEGVFTELPFQHIIIDEAHRLKNKNAKIITILRRLVCKRIFLLTGTPIQNNLSELWSLLNFIEPGVFNDLEAFARDFGDQMGVEHLQRLKQLLEPYLLRRMKDEVESSIPPLTETIIDVELTAVQKVVYKTLYEKNKGTLQKGLGMNCISIMNNLEMQLRKCCNHPFLINEIRQDLIKDCNGYDKYFEKMVQCSGKMIFLEKALEKFRREGKKVLVFSQFTEMLRLIEDYLGFKGWRYRKIDGSTKARDRQTAIDKFNGSSERFEIFLLSTKAGGLGINLTSASIVIIYDSDWNPQNDVQAIARAHRIGQTEEVKVFRLVSKKTYEAEMFERASKKLGLDQAILLTNSYANKAAAGDRASEEITKLKPEEIEVLLRKGMVGLLNQGEQAGEEQFAQDVDEIIQNARVANYSLVNGTYSFSKTRFLGNEKETAVQIDDPDFWKKIFLDQKSAADGLEREYRAFAAGDKAASLETQKAFFMRLSAEIYRYLEDRVKNEAFSADTEFKFSELLNALVSDDRMNSGLRELIGQLHQDFLKKSRRIKKIDEKAVNQAIKAPNGANDRSKRKAKEIDLLSPSTGKSRDRSRAREDRSSKEPKLAKRETIKAKKDDNEVFSESSKDNFQTKKKVKRDERPGYCEICGRSEPELICRGSCGRAFHPVCLETKVKVLLADRQKPVNDDTLHHYSSENSNSNSKEQEGSFANSMCYFCRSKTEECFECKRLGPVIPTKGAFEAVSANEGAAAEVVKCSVCPKHYHPRCVPAKLRTQKDPFRCAHHYCADCGEYSRTLHRCLKCTNSFHKKCMSKKNDIIENSFIVCFKHEQVKGKAKKVPVVETKSYEKILKSKKSSLIQALKSAPVNPPRQTESLRPNKKVKTQTNVYEKFAIEPPHDFDFSNFKEVSLSAMVPLLRGSLLGQVPRVSAWT